MRSQIGPFRALDFVFDIKAPRELAALFADVLGDLRVTSSAGTGRGSRLIDVRQRAGDWSVTCAPDPSRSGTVAEAIVYVIDVINQGAVQYTKSGVAIHAAAVHTDEGVIALAGTSGAGKSTLAAAAIASGMGYVADEVTMVDVDLTVRPFHRPLGIRPGGAEALRLEVPRHTDDRFGRIYPLRPDSSALHGGGPLVAVCIVQFAAGPETSWTEVRPAEALLELSAGTLGSGTYDERAWFRRLSEVASSVPVARMTYRDLPNAVAQLRRFFGAVAL